MKRIISLILIGVFVCSYCFFSPVMKVEAGATSIYQVRITTSTLRIRSGPGTNYKMVGTYRRGTVVNIYEEKGNWLKVYNQKQYRWIDSRYTEKIDKISANAKILKVTGSIVNVRSNAGLSYRVLTKVRNGNTYSYTETKKVKNVTWYKIKVNSNITGWICGTYVKPISNTSTNITTTKPNTTTTTTTNAIKKRFNLTSSQRDYIERVVAAEARGERYGGKVVGKWGTTYKGMVAVAQVIYDRTACPNNWGTTPYSTAAAKGQFAKPYKGTISKEVKAAVSAVFDYEYRVTEKPLYFFCMNNCYPSWCYTKTYVMTIGNHKFYR